MRGRIAGWYVAGWVLMAGFWLAASFKIAAIGTLVLGAVYWRSLVRHPTRACPRCQGSDRRSDGVFRGARGRGCGRRWCYGGDRIRWGVTLLRPAHAREIRAGR